MKSYNDLERTIAIIQEQENKINTEWAKIIKNLKDDNVHLDMELQTIERQLKRKTSELSELQNNFDTLREEYMFLKMQNIALEQKYHSITGDEVPKMKNNYISQEQYDDEIKIHNKKIKEMNGIIKTLRDKLGNKTVPLTVIVDEIKKRAKMVGIESAYPIFELFNSVLSDVPAWKSNKSNLENFFIEERERTLKALNVNIEKGALAQISEQPIINNSLNDTNDPKLPK